MMMKIRTNIIYNGDCKKGLNNIPKNSVDFILTDPPYKMDGNAKGGCGFLKDREYLKNIYKEKLHKGFNMQILEQFKRILKEMNLVIFCSKNQLRNYLNWIHKNNYNWILITWNKKNPIPAINNNYLPDTEYIFHIRKKGIGLNGNYNTKKRYYLTNVNKNKFKHPTVKPLKIIRNLIINSTNKKDIVLDPFLGSGTTALACQQLDRKFIGFEKEDKYIEIIKERLLQKNVTSFFNKKQTNNINFKFKKI